MTKKAGEQYWFKTKKYGWGWGMPSTRNGWIAYGLFVAVWLGSLAWLASTGSVEEKIPASNIAIFGFIILIDVTALLYVSLKYGESPKWRWGSKKRAAKSKSD